MDRTKMQQAFIRVCKDSGFKIPAVQAAQLAARMCSVHPLQILGALGADNMRAIAAGDHPVISKTP